MTVGNTWNAYYRTTMHRSPTDRSDHGRVRVAAVLLAAALSAIVTAACGLVSRSPSDDSADAGFARDMATHHAQAVELGFIIRDVSTDERLRALAYDIIVTQAAQRGMELPT